MKVCGLSKAPIGWYCTRRLGHEGPCAAVSCVSSKPFLTEWEKDCLHWRGKILRGPDAHWCNDCGLPVSAFTPEYDCCVDFKKTFLGRICNRLYMQYWDFRFTMARIDRETVAMRETISDDFK